METMVSYYRKYTRDSLNLTTSVESGLFLVDGSSGASSEEGLALGAVGCGRGWVMVTLSEEARMGREDDVE